MLIILRFRQYCRLSKRTYILITSDFRAVKYSTHCRSRFYTQFEVFFFYIYLCVIPDETRCFGGVRLGERGQMLRLRQGVTAVTIVLRSSEVWSFARQQPHPVAWRLCDHRQRAKRRRPVRRIL